ncbi:hypothetical protein BHE74_00056764 [Ensete ventricosum]|nr:hypothetical protein GW17_00058416 [Ensete ventricosum]RWW38037.1 hypothetical protein BHE74_00056764 [Ensete ventricosum]
MCGDRKVRSVGVSRRYFWSPYLPRRCGLGIKEDYPVNKSELVTVISLDAITSYMQSYGSVNGRRGIGDSDIRGRMRRGAELKPKASSSSSPTSILFKVTSGCHALIRVKSEVDRRGRSFSSDGDQADEVDDAIPTPPRRGGVPHPAKVDVDDDDDAHGLRGSRTHGVAVMFISFSLYLYLSSIRNRMFAGHRRTLAGSVALALAFCDVKLVVNCSGDWSCE